MITINLLPPAVRRSAAHRSLAALPWRPVGGGALGLLVVYSAWLLIGNHLQHRTLARLTAEWATLAPQQGTVERTRARLEAAQRRAAALQALKGPQARWAPRLNVLSDSLVAGLWFTGVQYGMPPEGSEGQPPDPSLPTTPRLWVTGSAIVLAEGEDAPVKRLLQRVQSHPEFAQWFHSIELKGVEHRRLGQESISDFALMLVPSGAGA